MCPNWEEGGRGQCSMGRVSFAPTASLCSLWSLAGDAADGMTPALPTHPISARSLPAGSSESSAPPAPSWPAAGCQAWGCQAVCAGKPSAGSASRAQPPCSGSGPRPPPSSGETPPTPVWGHDDRGDLQPVPPPCSLPDPTAWASPAAAASSLRPLYLPGSLHFANKLWHLDAVAGFGDEGGGVEEHPQAR